MVWCVRSNVCLPGLMVGLLGPAGSAFAESPGVAAPVAAVTATGALAPANPALAAARARAPTPTPTPGHDVNPFTGVPLSLEQARWALEQSRLEEQLQASLLNRRKLESERQRLEGAGLEPALAAPLSALHAPPVATVGGKSDGLPRKSGDGADRMTARPGRRDRTASFAQPVGQRPPVILGVRQNQGQWCVLVQQPAGMQAVCPGQAIQGQTLQSVSAQGYQLGGIQHALDVGPILLAPQRTLPESPVAPASADVALGLPAQAEVRFGEHP